MMSAKFGWKILTTFLVIKKSNFVVILLVFYVVINSHYYTTIGSRALKMWFLGNFNIPLHVEAKKLKKLKKNFLGYGGVQTPTPRGPITREQSGNSKIAPMTPFVCLQAFIWYPICPYCSKPLTSRGGARLFGTCTSYNSIACVNAKGIQR